MRTSPRTYRVWLYTRSGCPECDEARQWLTARSIPFTEELIPANPLGTSGSGETTPIGTPLLVVGDRAVYGFRPVAFELALRRAQSG